jgi:hypothetical protein
MNNDDLHHNFIFVFFCTDGIIFKRIILRKPVFGNDIVLKIKMKNQLKEWAFEIW